MENPRTGYARAQRMRGGGLFDPDGDFPFPFACFWTCLLTLLAGFPAHSFLVTLLMAAAGLWLGVKLDEWLRRHPLFGNHRLRVLLGVE